MTASPIFALDDLLRDIPRDVAYQAHAGTSHTPSARVEGEQRSYAAGLLADLDALMKRAKTDAGRAVVVDAAQRYREGYRSRYLVRLRTRHGLVSTNVTGGSNFPVRKMEKINKSLDLRAAEFAEWRKKTQARILRDVKAADIEAQGGRLAILRATVERDEARRDLMKAANKVCRSKKLTDAEKLEGLIGLGLDEDVAKGALTPDYMGRLGFAPFVLQNLGATIRRNRAKIAEEEAKEAQAAAGGRDDVTTNLDGVEVVYAYDDERLRLVFASKPAAEMRAKLKSRGFRWSRHAGAWQRQLTHNAVTTAGVILGVELPPLVGANDAG